MGSKNIEEKFNVKISYSLENSEKKTENSLHKTLQDRQANRCRLRGEVEGRKSVFHGRVWYWS